MSQSYRRCISALSRISQPLQLAKDHSQNTSAAIGPMVNARSRDLLRTLNEHISHLLESSLQDIKSDSSIIHREMVHWSTNRDHGYLTLKKMSDYKLLQTVMDGTDKIEKKILYIHQTTDILSTNTCDDFSNFAPFEILSMQGCINQALDQYVFCGDDKDKIVWQAGADFRFLGCGDLITYILFNLLRNALRASKEAGDGQISIYLETGMDNNRLCFRDRGCGISKSNLPTIFNDFVSHTSKTMGLGLGFCRKAMKHLGGNIECQSQQGKYTLFTLFFPK